MRLVACAGPRAVLFGRVAREVVPLGRVSRVPGLPSPALGMVLVGGRATLVVALSPDHAAEAKLGVLCDIAGDGVVFAATKVQTDAEVEPNDEIDVDAVVGLLENEVWAQRANRLKVRDG